MKQKLKITILLILCCISIFQAQVPSKGDLVIKNINILTLTNATVLRNKSILIRAGKIIKIDDYKKLHKSKTTAIIDGYGKYIMPGLAEMHSHLPIESKVDTLLMENVAAGVTQLRIMNAKTSQVQLRKRLENNPNRIAPKLHYSHIITRDVKYSETQFDSLMLEIKRNKIDFIKLFSISNEQVFDNLMKSANRHNIIVCGHYPSGIAMDKVLNSGYKSIEHLAGYEKITDESELAKVIQLTKEKRVFNCPTLDWDIMSKNLQYPNDYKNRLIYDNAPNKYLKRWELDYSTALEKEGIEKILDTKKNYLPTFARKQSIIKKLNENNCLLLIGSDAGINFQMNGFNMFEEMYHWSQVGIDNFTILQSATVTPSIFFNEDHLWGTIEIGKAADFVILKKNPLEDITNMKTVEMTIIDGKIYLKKEILSKL